MSKISSPVTFLSLAMISSFASFNNLYFITFTSKEKELDRQFLSARSLLEKHNILC